MSCNPCPGTSAETPPRITMFSLRGGRYSDARAEIGADAVTDRLLKQQELERLGAVEAQIVRVDEGTQFRRHVEIRAQVENVNPGIYEVRLAFFLARPQIGQQAHRIHQRHAGAGQADAFWSQKLKSLPAK